MTYTLKGHCGCRSKRNSRCVNKNSVSWLRSHASAAADLIQIRRFNSSWNQSDGHCSCYLWKVASIIKLWFMVTHWIVLACDSFVFDHADPVGHCWCFRYCLSDVFLSYHMWREMAIASKKFRGDTWGTSGATRWSEYVIEAEYARICLLDWLQFHYFEQNTTAAVRYIWTQIP